jgi:hypothetical protein
MRQIPITVGKRFHLRIPVDSSTCVEYRRLDLAKKESKMTMKNWIKWTTALAFAGAIAMSAVGCGGSEEATGPDFSEAFGVTPPQQPMADAKAAETYTSQYKSDPVQQRASQALVLEQQEDWTGAMVAFDQLQKMEGVTPNQWLAARTKKQQLTQKLIELQAQGKSAEAERVIRQLNRR